MVVYLLNSDEEGNGIQVKIDEDLVIKDTIRLDN